MLFIYYIVLYFGIKHTLNKKKNHNNIKDIYLYVFHHGAFLSIKFSAVRTFEHMHFLFGQVSVKMHVQQRFLGKNCIAHDTLVDHPVKIVRSL